MAFIKYENQELHLPKYFDVISKYNGYYFMFLSGLWISITCIIFGIFFSFTFGSDWNEWLPIILCILIIGSGITIFGWRETSILHQQLLNADEMKQAWNTVIEKIRKRVLSKLGVDDDTLYANQQLIISPKIINNGDNKLFFIKDKNNYIYSSLIDIHLLGITKNYLSFYTASVNLQTGEIFNENTDEWFLEDIMAPSTRGLDISEIDSIAYDIWSMRSPYSTKNSNAFMVPVLIEPESGWSKTLTLSNLITANTEFMEIKKTTGLDLFVIENKNGRQLKIQLLSEDFLEQMGANKPKEIDKAITAIKTMIRNKRN